MGLSLKDYDITNVNISGCYYDTPLWGEKVFPCYSIGAECVHTARVYAIVAGRYDDDDKNTVCHFELEAWDDETDEHKSFKLTLGGGAERRILAKLLRTAAEILETGKLEVTP